MFLAILTAFPGMFTGPFDDGMIRIARELEKLTVELIDLRRFTTDRHRTIDDAPFGGGAGMILRAGPIKAGLEAADEASGGRCHRVLMGPVGERLDQSLARELSAEPRVALIAGRYKDVDDRVRREIDREVSIGDYVVSGGELPAMVVVDAVARLLPGVVGDDESVLGDSFEHGMLDAPYYTRPAELGGQAVPDALRSGNHAEIKRWRRKESLRRTLLWRPDLLAGDDSVLDDGDLALIAEIGEEVAVLTREIRARGHRRDEP